MRLRVDVVDAEKRSVARLVWSGKLYSGMMTVRKVDDQAERAKQIRDLFAARTDLSRFRFRSMGTRSEVRGWEGFEGAFGAARMVLPALGLSLGDVVVVKK